MKTIKFSYSNIALLIIILFLVTIILKLVIINQTNDSPEQSNDTYDVIYHWHDKTINVDNVSDYIAGEQYTEYINGIECTSVLDRLVINGAITYVYFRQCNDSQYTIYLAYTENMIRVEF